MKCDVCVIGSGAGGAPVAYQVARAGYSVVVLERGPWLRTSDFRKDEIACCRRDTYTPPVHQNPHEIRWQDENGKWHTTATHFTGRTWWNATCVGGATNIMSGFFHRLKPQDFRLLSTYGEIAGAQVADWPITYEELEPYYAEVEQLVGVSGRVVPHRFLEPRSTPDFPLPPLRESIVAQWIDGACRRLNIECIPTPRAILSEKLGWRGACYYSGYCGSYGCASNAKGSARVTFIAEAVRTGNCTVIPNAQVYYLETDGGWRVRRAWYRDAEGKKEYVEAQVFVVACYAIETCRLLLYSKNKRFDNGLGNNHGLVGKFMISSAGGVGGGIIRYSQLDPVTAEELKNIGLWINRTVQHFYEIEHPHTGKPIKGGTIEFMFEHANPIRRAVQELWEGERLIWGKELKEKLMRTFLTGRQVRFEVFADWLPTHQFSVTLSRKYKDRWGVPAAAITIYSHPHDQMVGEFLCEQAARILQEAGVEAVWWRVSRFPSPNLIGGGCRAGTDPRTSVVDRDCRIHDLENLYVTDGSIFPTGGSVPFTFTIYANALRVGRIIAERL